jgi:hypothetical protein
MKLHYYSSDRQPQVLSSRASCWPAPPCHMMWTAFLSNFLVSVDFYCTRSIGKHPYKITHIITPIYLFILLFVCWRSRCPHADQILPKLPVCSYLPYILAFTGMTCRKRELYPVHIYGEIIRGPFFYGRHTQYSRQFGPHTFGTLATSATKTAPINR